MLWKRIAALMLVAATWLCSACSAGTADPVPTPGESAFAPVLASSTLKAKISIPAYRIGDAQKAVLERLNGMLGESGQSVEFVLQQKAYDASGVSSYFTNTQKELASGAPSADAYALNFIESKELFDGGMTMEMSGLVLQNAPVYRSKYVGLFPDPLPGVPVGIFSRPLWFKPALMLKDGVALPEGSTGSLEGFLRFAGDIASGSKGKQVLQARPEEVLFLWAEEQGYYPLNMFQVDGYLFARTEDHAFTPLPMEDIPGFAGFFTELMGQYKSGSLWSGNPPGEGKEVAGFLKRLGEYYLFNPHSTLMTAEGQYSAHIMHPELPTYFVDPVYVQELSVPASCPQDKAALVVRFVEWLYAAQENYDLVLYGVYGEDYSLRNGRYAPLSEGKPVNLLDYAQVEKLFCAWPGAEVFGNLEYYRLPSHAPAGIEQLVDTGLSADLRFPLNTYIKTDRKSLEVMLDTSDEMKKVCLARDDIVNSLLYLEPGLFSEELLNNKLEQLKNCNNGWLCGEYHRMIRGFTEK